MSNTTHYVFESVKFPIKKSGKCKCGKRLVRATTFEQTINPFNKNAAGKVKTYSEIWAELKAQAAAWKATPTEHDHERFWGLPQEKRDAYDKGEDITVTMTCGETTTIRKPGTKEKS